ncbi:hypothetical protein CK203_045906 [Vitis vinifera]|uniref:Uncharacterized protein n=1 Tax=Vitis vinifera TaxID=29760 RepID=A0A438I523_VITVI|nr:hypothetical protein CK203_045906 [Vitis vinifera]
MIKANFRGCPLFEAKKSLPHVCARAYLGVTDGSLITSANRQYGAACGKSPTEISFRGTPCNRPLVLLIRIGYLDLVIFIWAEIEGCHVELRGIVIEVVNRRRVASSGAFPGAMSFGVAIIVLVLQYFFPDDFSIVYLSARGVIAGKFFIRIGDRRAKLCSMIWAIPNSGMLARPTQPIALRCLQKRTSPHPVLLGKTKMVARIGVSFGSPSSGKPTKLLNEQEFRERFFIPNGVSIQLVDGDPTSIEKTAHGAIFFSKEQFNVGSTFLSRKDRRGRLVEWVEIASFVFLNNLFKSLQMKGTIRRFLLPETCLRLSESPNRTFFPSFLNGSLREEKRQEGKLKRVPGRKGLVSSFATCPPVRKKKPSAKATKVSDLVPASPSAFTHFASTSTDSSVQASQGSFDFLDFELSDSGTHPSEPEPEPIALNVINEMEVEDSMATDLRVGFKERHRKCLHEAIEVAAPQPKEPIQRLDDIMEMLRRVPCFTDAESPSTKMSDFFPLTKRISVNLGGEPLVSSQPDSFSARPSSPYPVFSNCKIARCKRLRKWVCNMVRQRALLFEWLEVAKAMWTFISHRMSIGEELRAKLERAESNLVVAQKAAMDGAEALKLAEEKKEAIRTKVDKLREEGFAAQKKNLEAEYQKQVDEMYFFSYRCCMKKNGITQDILSFPSDDEDEVPNDSFL